MQTTINFRVEKDLKEQFEKIAAEMDRTTSQLFREFMRHIVSEKTARTTTETPRSKNNDSPKATPKAKAKKPPKSVIPTNWRAK